MARATVALLSDFGLRDHYVGAMKGVILGICPDAVLVDITHDVPVHDVLTAGLELSAVYRLFPAGTIFLVVVDPGVEDRSARRRRSPSAEVPVRRGRRRSGADGGFSTHTSEECCGADRTSLRAANCK